MITVFGWGNKQMGMNEDLHKLAYAESWKTFVSYASATLKSLLLLSGGAGTALLAFMGHMVTLGRLKEASLLATPIFIFFGSSFLTCVTLGFSYLSQAAFHKAFDARDAVAHKQCNDKGERLTQISIITTIFSFALSFTAACWTLKVFLSLASLA